MNYTIQYIRENAGGWSASLKELPAVTALGETMGAVRKRIREALRNHLGSDEAAIEATFSDYVAIDAERPTALPSTYPPDRTAADNVVSLDVRRGATFEAAYQAGQVFKFQCMHLDNYHQGTTEDGLVVLNLKDTNDGFSFTEDEARAFGVALIECAGQLRAEREQLEEPG